jgi:Amt family ammonium transporter
MPRGSCITASGWKLSGIVSLVALTVVKYTVGLRVNEDAAREGVDIASHGEAAYEV